MKKVLMVCAATLSGFLVGVGCSGGGKVGLGDKATATVGATGGTVENSAGLTIEIPAGAVDGAVHGRRQPRGSGFGLRVPVSRSNVRESADGSRGESFVGRFVSAPR